MDKRIVPVSVGDKTVYMSITTLDRSARDEAQISGGQPAVDQALDAIAAFAREAISYVGKTNATRVRIEFGCEFVVASGAFFAVIGKASSEASLKVELEWNDPQVLAAQ